MFSGALVLSETLNYIEQRATVVATTQNTPTTTQPQPPKSTSIMSDSGADSGATKPAICLPAALDGVSTNNGLTFGKHPPWYAPVGGEDLGLRVNNSLTGPIGRQAKPEELVAFKPAKGRLVKWYTCGPTVYDSCHMGHARAYLTFDILRRIVEDYYGYDVMYHVNITDVDDKIIKRARVNKFITDYATECDAMGDKGVEKATADVQQAVSAKIEKLEKKLLKLEQPLPKDAGTQAETERDVDIKETTLKLGQANLAQASLEAVASAIKKGYAVVAKEYFEKATALSGAIATDNDAWSTTNALVESLSKINATQRTSEADETLNNAKRLRSISVAMKKVTTLGNVRALIEAARTEIGDALDDERKETIDGTNHDIFNAHARKFEKEYVNDMERLGVRNPDVLTRVTENIDKIMDFVDVIVKKGLAYESNGSVYLSVEGFAKAGHHYRKLKPGAFSEKDMAESEGDLANGDSEKKHQNDFALWKASKPGEPMWKSPWGMGRPGWHIECSAIAGDILGENMDVHAGGIDLKFPHHDNELAQSEACYGHHQWVSYFFHAGHLHIQDLKMSKSLKNFITIEQALEKSTARQLRIMFLLQQWDKPMTYSEQAVDAAKKKEARFKSFFSVVSNYLKQDFLAATDRDIGWALVDRALSTQLMETQVTVHEGLCANFNTAVAMGALDELIGYINKVFETAEAAKPQSRDLYPANYLLEKCALYITKLFRVFGVIEGGDGIGFPQEGGQGVVAPFIDAMLNFREKIRTAHRNKADPQEYLVACDELRDVVLVDLGVRVADVADATTGARWDMANPEEMRRELEQKKLKDLEKARGKIKNKMNSAIKKLEKDRKASVAPDQLFRSDEFTEYDPNGLPTKRKDGESISGKAAKGFTKTFDKHAKAYATLLKEADNDLEAFFAKCEASIASLAAQLE
eukprot:m.213818 g.213818  ORF g.213818 m.213818 type:complete len:925 (+) comp33159_c0_seq1:114-2888(+)